MQFWKCFFNLPIYHCAIQCFHFDFSEEAFGTERRWDDGTRAVSKDESENGPDWNGSSFWYVGFYPIFFTAHWSRMKSFCSEIISIEKLSKDTSMDLVLCRKSKNPLLFNHIFQGFSSFSFVTFYIVIGNPMLRNDYFMFFF